METLIFNSYVGGACIFEYSNMSVDVLRTNEQYAGELGYFKFAGAVLSGDKVFMYLDEENKKKFADSIHASIDSGKESSCELELSDGEHYENIRITLRVIARAGDRFLFYCVVVNMTQQRNISEHLRTIVDNIYGGVTATVIRNGRPEFIIVNDWYIKMLGFESREQFEAENGAKYMSVHPDDRERIMKQFETSDGGKKQYTMEYRIVRIDGQIRYIRNNICVINLIGIDEPVQLSVANDITEIRIAQQKERRVTQQMQIIMKNINGGIMATVYHNKNNVEVVYASDGFYQMYGYTKEQFETEVNDVLELIIPEDRQIAMNKVAHIIQTRGSESYEYRCRRRDGKIIWVKCNNSVVSIDGIDDNVLLAVTNDVTTEIEAHEQFRFFNESAHDIVAHSDSDAIQTLMDDTPGGFCRIKLNNDLIPQIEYINKGFCRIMNMTYDEIMSEYGENASECLTPNDVAITYADAEKAVKSMEQFTIRCGLRNKYGRSVRTIMSGRFVKDESGDLYLNLFFTDITIKEKKEEQQKNLLDNLPCGAALYEFDGKNVSVIHINKKYWQLVKRDPVNYDDASVLDVVYESDRNLVYNEIKAAISQNRDASCDIRIKYGESEYRPFHVTANVTPQVDGKYALYTTYTQISDHTMSIQEMLPVALYTMMSISGDRSYVKGIDLRYICCSKSAVKGFGFDNEREIIGKTDFDLFDKENAQRIVDEDKKIISSGKSLINHVEQFRSKKNGIRISDTSKYPLVDTSGNIVGIYGVSRDITDQKEYEEKLRIAGEEYKIAAEHSGRTICHYNILTHTVKITAEASRRLLLPEYITDVPYGRVKLGLISEDTSRAYIEFYEKIINGEKEWNVVFEKMLPNKEWRWINAQSTTIFSDDGIPVSAVISFIDVTDQNKREEIYKKWQQSFDYREPDSYSLFRCNLSKADSFDSFEGNLISVKKDDKTMSFDDCTLKYVRQMVYLSDRKKFVSEIKTDKLIADYYRGSRKFIIEYREITAPDRYRWIRLSIELIEQPHTKNIMAYLLFENIDKVKKEILEVLERSQTDPLTGVLNRKAFETRVNSIIRKSRSDQKHAMMMLDVDSFKHINDSMGHKTGDQVLIEITKHIRSVLRNVDLIGRLGGDEFMLFFVDISEGIAEEIAQRICELTRKQIDKNVTVSISLGIAVYPDCGDDFSSLYKKADKALYFVKGSGKNNYVFYNKSFIGMEPNKNQDEC